MVRYVAFAALALIGPVGAQMQWWRVEAGAAGALGAEQIVYDQGRGVVVLFGGTALSGTTPYHLLEWNGAQWTTPSPGAVSPSGRFGAAMAFDQQRGRMVVFGGRCAGSCPGGPGPVVLDDTWEYDGVWTPRATVHRPPARYGASMAFDGARQRIVLFGGRDQAGAPRLDTWEYDGLDWLQRSPQTSPAGTGPMAFVPPLLGVAMVQGALLWRWNGFDWASVPGQAPQWADALVWDAARARLCVYSPAYPATWEWDGIAWSQRPESAPSPEVSFAMTYDPLAARVVWVTTIDLGTPTFRDTWSFAPVWRAEFAPYGSRCVSPASEPELRAQAGQLPWLGGEFSIELDGVATDSAGALLALGFSPVPPTELVQFGWSGCYQYVAVDSLEVMDLVGSTAHWTTTVPANAALIGAEVHLQAVAFDVQAVGGAVTSNAARAVVGVR